MTRRMQVAVDCSHPYALAQFWTEVLGHEIAQRDAGPEGNEFFIE